MQSVWQGSSKRCRYTAKISCHEGELLEIMTNYVLMLVLQSRKQEFTECLLDFIQSSSFAACVFLSGVEMTNRTDAQMLYVLSRTRSALSSYLTSDSGHRHITYIPKIRRHQPHPRSQLSPNFPFQSTLLRSCNTHRPFQMKVQSHLYQAAVSHAASSLRSLRCGRSPLCLCCNSLSRETIELMRTYWLQWLQRF